MCFRVGEGKGRTLGPRVSKLHRETKVSVVQDQISWIDAMGGIKGLWVEGEAVLDEMAVEASREDNGQR